jgi:hypothetical protein
MVIKTCVASYDETLAVNDHKFIIQDGGNPSITELKDIDGGTSCAVSDKVKLVTDSDGFHFQNSANKDCLVTVTIT